MASIANLSNHSFQSFLVQEFERRKSKNQKYSLRSFAKNLKVNAGRLSEVLNGKRIASIQMRHRICDRLSVPLSVFYSTELNQQNTYTKISEENCYHVLAEWEHYAILSLIKTVNFKNDISWISARLGISKYRTTVVLNRLIKTKLISIENNRITRIDSNLTSSSDITSKALQESHQQDLRNAIDKLKTVSVQFRDISSITMAIDIKRIPEAKSLIKKFRREMAALLEKGTQSEVYNLNVQLVPVTIVR